MLRYYLAICKKGLDTESVRATFQNITKSNPIVHCVQHGFVCNFRAEEINRALQTVHSTTTERRGTVHDSGEADMEDLSFALLLAFRTFTSFLSEYFKPYFGTRPKNRLLERLERSGGASENRRVCHALRCCDEGLIQQTALVRPREGFTLCIFRL